MALNTCSDLIIHPVFKPYHLNANHSNISFGIALRNLSNKQSFILEKYVPDNNPSLSEDYIFNVQPISVALPAVSSEATLNSSEPLIVPNTTAATEILDTNEPSSSTQTIPQSLTTNVSPPPTLLLDYIILKEVCENIFQDLNKLVKTRSNFVHEKNYTTEWTTLRKRVDYVMCELQKLSLEAHD